MNLCISIELYSISWCDSAYKPRSSSTSTDLFDIQIRKIRINCKQDAEPYRNEQDSEKNILLNHVARVRAIMYLSLLKF